MTRSILRIVVFVSGNGTNLQRIIDLQKSGELPVTVAAVFSDNENAYALKRAEREKIKTIWLNPRNYNTRCEFDQSALRQIEPLQPDLIVLAGFMRILSAEFVSQYENRILNIHPSLLPKLKGKDTHARVLAQGDKYHGATVHFVTSDLDSGPIVAQKKFKVRPFDTIESLKQRVHECEYEIYPQAIRQVWEQKINREL